MNSLRKHTIFKTSTIKNGNMSFRFGEKDEVTKNRYRFLKKNGLSYDDCICMRCNHGSIIKAVSRDRNKNNLGAVTLENMLQAEVLTTNDPSVSLMLLTADCLPVAFFDPVRQVIALAHLNRRTIAHNLGQKTVRFLMKHYDTDPNDLIVAIGPHIKKESYRFPLPLTEPTPKQLLEHMQTMTGYISIDLVSAELAQLSAVGVQKKKISVSKIDTATSQNRFSHYRSQRDPTHSHGRMATILSLLPTQK